MSTPPPLFCSFCGRALTPRAQFCPACGNDLGGRSQTPPQSFTPGVPASPPPPIPPRPLTSPPPPLMRRPPPTQLISTAVSKKGVQLVFSNVTAERATQLVGSYFITHDFKLTTEGPSKCRYKKGSIWGSLHQEFDVTTQTIGDFVQVNVGSPVVGKGMGKEKRHREEIRSQLPNFVARTLAAGMPLAPRQ